MAQAAGHLPHRLAAACLWPYAEPRQRHGAVQRREAGARGQGKAVSDPQTGGVGGLQACEGQPRGGGRIGLAATHASGPIGIPFLDRCLQPQL